MAHTGENKVWVCRSCGAAGGPLRSEAAGAAHVRARHAAARCACGAILAGSRALRAHAAAHHAYRCPVSSCSDTFAVQYLLERHMQVHHTVVHQVESLTVCSNIILYRYSIEYDYNLYSLIF